jgi:hypothetical protein
MAVKCEFIDLIIPISKIDAVYPGGFAKFKEEHAESRIIWYDDYLCRDGAMSPMEISAMADSWERLGLKGVVTENGEMKWGDFCVVESLFRGPTLPCDWLVFDREDPCVYLKDTPKGEIIGRSR